LKLTKKERAAQLELYSQPTLSKKELLVQLERYPVLDARVAAVAKALARGTVVAPPAMYRTDKDIITTLHAQLTVLYRTLNRYHGRFLPLKDPVLNAAVNAAHKVLNDTQQFTRGVVKDETR